MNRVVSIEIASQVFWIDENAYAVLAGYLAEIKQQLHREECADEIFNDIELRIAELLFLKNSHHQRALNVQHIDDVINQVGYIDTDEEENVKSVAKQSYRDVHNKILGGVCAGLSVRFNTSVVVIRLLFIALAAVFGLGIIIYVVFWLILDSNTSRKTALAAQGRPQTAKQLANYDKPRVSPIHKLQKIIFLPFSILGFVMTHFVQHFKKRKRGYQVVIKSFVSFGLLFSTFILVLLVNNFIENDYFWWPVKWLSALAVMFIAVYCLVYYYRKFYAYNKSMDKRLKVFAVISLLIVLSASIYLNYVTDVSYQSTTEQKYNLAHTPLNIRINDLNQGTLFSDYVDYQFQVDSQLKDSLEIVITYVGYGINREQAIENVHMMNFDYSYDNNTLTLDDQWVLKDGAFNRSQSLQVIIRLPTDHMIVSSHEFNIIDDIDGYTYKVNDISLKKIAINYQTKGAYIHESDDHFSNRISANEKHVLDDLYCDTFFNYWDCPSNIRQLVEHNDRFDKAFIKDIEIINALRQFLLDDRSIFNSHLDEMAKITDGLRQKYPVIKDLDNYIKHLIRLKSHTEPI